MICSIAMLFTMLCLVFGSILVAGWKMTKRTKHHFHFTILCIISVFVPLVFILIAVWKMTSLLPSSIIIKSLSNYLIKTLPRQLFLVPFVMMEVAPIIIFNWETKITFIYVYSGETKLTLYPLSVHHNSVLIASLFQ